GLEPPLPGKTRRSIVGRDVLDEDEPSARLQDALHLGERPVEALDRAEDERRDDGVERGSVERETLGRRVDHLDRSAKLANATLEVAPHGAVGLGEDEAFDGGGIMMEVRARAGADLEHAPGERAEELPPPRSEALLLGALHEAVVDERQEPGHGLPISP